MVNDPPAPHPELRPQGTMKAWMLDRYGAVDGLALRDVPFPVFRDDHEVLVRVFGSSVNPADRHMLNPPFMFRRGQGFLRPKWGRIGLDLAGRVASVGPSVKEIHVGDEVYGVGRGAFGEYAIADEAQVAPKPARLTFEQAAAVPLAATTALQGLRDKANVGPGQRVLINGASGGVGSFAVQIAKSLGAQVSCVCSPQNVEWVTSLEVDRVFDYSREDFTQSGSRYDVIFDTQLNHSLAEYRRSLNPGGLLLIVGAGPGNVARLLRRLIRTMLATRFVGPKTKFFIASVKKIDLTTLTQLVDAGKLAPVVDRSYALDQVPDALRYLIEGHARGKIVVSVSPTQVATTT
ncbi:MAG: NAD(P)-dependent alcohol dehydrogenase [Thermoplasmata archaeon]|nr:NAD(P)-dependent alcohol dehydrogenase [Thermoplasmata archaeon]